MEKFDDDIDNALVLLMELLYTALGKERISWYEPDDVKWKDSLDKEILRIEGLWWRVRFLGIDDTVRQPYIQRQQLVLVHCLDWIEVIIGEDNELFEIAQFANNKVEYLLQILFVYFRKDFKMDLPFPNRQQVLLIHSLKHSLSALQKKLQQSPLQIELKASIVACFIHFIKAASFTRYTYGQGIMMQELMEWLSQTRQMKTLPVFLHLCYLNCNYMEFYRVARKWFDRSGSQTIETAIRFRRLAKFWKRMRVKKGYCWRRDRISLSLLLADYLADRADIAESNINLQAVHSGLMAPDSKTNDRLQVFLTIEQLGLMIRIMKDTNVFGSRTTSGIIRFCINHLLIGRRGQDGTISYEYLKACIHKSRPEVYDLLEERLNGMLFSIRKLRIAYRQGKKNKD